MATFTVYHAMSGEKAAATSPVGTALISGTFNAETYATGGVELTAALINAGLSTFGAQMTVASLDNCVINGDEVDGTYYGEFIRSSKKIKISATADESEASAGALDVEFPCTIAVTLA